MAKDTISKAPKIVATPTASEQQPEDGLASFSVYIPKCLLGERMIRAADEADALRRYKELGGIRGTNQLPVVKRVQPGTIADEISKIEATV